MQGEWAGEMVGPDVWETCRELIPAGSVFAFLAEHREALFPAEFFADMYPSANGRPSLPPQVLATTVVLQSLTGLSDFETVQELRCDQYARLVGGLVTAVDLEPEKLELARRLGADQTVNARTHDPAEEIKKAGGADVALVLAASPKAFEQAYKSLNRGGRLVMVALPADNAAIKVPIFETVLFGISVIGSIVGTRQDLAEVFALHAAGRTQVIAEQRSLEQVNDSFDEVLDGRAEARLVFGF
ncbi:zinc-binding dehydrogenase [Streptomyces sp. NPDC046909]|uniref:zinc-binding dehydrogenase n=1 Tax=Streptomyces sp. NPDC046909 TaxID=3155617 RepID=UPI0033C37D72